MLICKKTICFDDVINKTTICKIVIYEESTCCYFSGTLWKKIYVIPISSSNLLKFLEERKSKKILATIIWFHNPSSNFFGWWMRACILITIITHELLPSNSWCHIYWINHVVSFFKALQNLNIYIIDRNTKNIIHRLQLFSLI